MSQVASRPGPAVAARSTRMRVPRRLIGLLLVIAVAATAWLWLRESPLVAVERVEITGLSSSQAAAVEGALRRAAADMTTLHVREDVLETAVEPYESVQSVAADADFPRTLNIAVTEKRMVAVVSVGGAETAVAADGRLLRGVVPPESLPELDAGRVVASDRLEDREALGAVAVLAAAPPELRPRVERARRGDRGLVLQMREGPDLIFGNRRRVRAKWAAAARVLAEPSAVGAVYLDLRLPERVAAGGVAPTPEPTPGPTVAPTAPVASPALETPVPGPAATAAATTAPAAP